MSIRPPQWDFFTEICQDKTKLSIFRPIGCHEWIFQLLLHHLGRMIFFFENTEYGTQINRLDVLN